MILSVLHVLNKVCLDLTKGLNKDALGSSGTKSHTKRESIEGPKTSCKRQRQQSDCLQTSAITSCFLTTGHTRLTGIANFAAGPFSKTNTMYPPEIVNLSAEPPVYTIDEDHRMEKAADFAGCPRRLSASMSHLFTAL